jgi:REP element-mobilizing transposase RayT
MSNPVPLQYDTMYHIYNRGNNGEDLFIEERNYDYFLQLYIRHIYPAVETYAYCLLRNHFHLLIWVKSEHEVPKAPSQYFANFFNAYAKAINKAYGRSGSLFERPFQRIPVLDEVYFARLVTYIHLNPVRHGFVDEPAEWPFSSYHALRATGPTRLRRDVVLDWFGGQEGFVSAHAVDLADLDLTGLPDLSGLEGL